MLFYFIFLLKKNSWKKPTFSLTVVFGAAGTVIAGTVVVIEAVEVTLIAWLTLHVVGVIAWVLAMVASTGVGLLSAASEIVEAAVEVTEVVLNTSPKNKHFFRKLITCIHSILYPIYLKV